MQILKARFRGHDDFMQAYSSEKDTGTLFVSNRPRHAAAIERRQSTGKGLLHADGASRGNIFTGDAADAVLTMASAGRKHGRIALKGTAILLAGEHAVRARLVNLSAGGFLASTLVAAPQPLLGQSVDIELRLDDGRSQWNRLEGVGVTEAPRGTLFHHYQVKPGGLLTRIELEAVTVLAVFDAAHFLFDAVQLLMIDYRHGHSPIDRRSTQIEARAEDCRTLVRFGRVSFAKGRQSLRPDPYIPRNWSRVNKLKPIAIASRTRGPNVKDCRRLGYSSSDEAARRSGWAG